MKKLIALFFILWNLACYSQCDSVGVTTHDSIFGYTAGGCRFSLFGFKWGCTSIPIIQSISHDTVFSVSCPEPEADTINFGVFYNRSPSGITPSIDDALYIGCATLRYNFVWGNINRINEIHAAGLKCHMFYNDAAVNTMPTPVTDTNITRSRLISIFNSGEIPEWASYLNEFSNKGYYAVINAANYIKNYTCFINVCHEYGIKAGDGAVIQNVLYSVFEYYRDYKTSAEFSWFKTASGINSVTSTQAQYWIKYYDTVITAFAASQADFVGVHWQEAHGVSVDGGDGIPLSGLFPAVLEFLRVKTGKPVYLTEFAVDNSSTEYFNRWLDQIKTNKVTNWIYYDGAGPNSVAQPDTYKTYISTYNGLP